MRTVQVINSHDGDYRGVSFDGINPVADKYFHCNSIKDAIRLKELIDDIIIKTHEEAAQ